MMAGKAKTESDTFGRVCTKCGIYKTWPYFHVSRKERTGHKEQCADCANKQKRKHDQKHKRDNTYGLFPGEFDIKLKEQNGKCAICLITLIIGGQKSESLEMDHDHRTNKNREILCKACNRMLGGAKDNPETLEAGAAYLRRNSCLSSP